MRSPDVVVTRIYDQPEPDRYRVLIDGLWPRGIARADAPIDEWRRDIAPSNELRRWYRHDPSRFPAFAQRYRAELAEPPRAAALTDLRSLARTRPLALVTATKAVDVSHAAVLAELLGSQRSEK